MLKNTESLNQDESHSSAVVELLGIYAVENRPEDAVILLDGATQWSADDLRLILISKDSMGVPVGFSAAKSLAATSHNDVAIRILEELMERLPGYDPAYQLYIDIVGSKAVAKLDELAARDQFEERPLIWEAQILFSVRNLDVAEQTVRKAIAIDPSDGDEGKGDRLRAYALLADILEAKLDTKNAETYRHAVGAIRISENADDYYGVGLYNKAFGLYREALDQFSNAYCVQSRLAIQLNKLGQFSEAVQHYKQAYELMPTSFGRVESHCFGCESVFKDANAQTIAEQVFMEALSHDAKKPQTHYLLGYLREEEQRYPEALQYYREAVSLDPAYLNAWKHLDKMSDYTYIDANERDSTKLKLLSLDPRQRHVQVSLESVGNFERLWQTINAVEDHSTHAGDLYRLKAKFEKTQSALQKLPPSLQKQMELYQSMMVQQQQ